MSVIDADKVLTLTGLQVLLTCWYRAVSGVVVNSVHSLPALWAEEKRT